MFVVPMAALAALIFATPPVLKQMFKVANWLVVMPLAIACGLWVAVTATDYFGRPAVEQIEAQMIQQQGKQRIADQQREQADAAKDASYQAAIQKANADAAQARTERDEALTEAGQANLKVQAYEQAQQQHVAALALQKKRDVIAASAKYDDYSNTIFSLPYPTNWSVSAYNAQFDANVYQDHQGTNFHPDDDQTVKIEAHGFYGSCNSFNSTTLDHWYFTEVNYIKQNGGKIISAQRTGNTSYHVIGKLGDAVTQQAATVDQASDTWTSSGRCLRAAVVTATYPIAREKELGAQINQMIGGMNLMPTPTH
jgi:hypothetical protein